MGGLHKGFFSIKEYWLLEITEQVSSYLDENAHYFADGKIFNI
jgi:hypothetical protein